MNSAQQLVRTNPQVLQELGLSEDDRPEIERVAISIQSGDSLTVSKFGRDVSEHTSSYADSLLDQVRNRDLDDAGAKLTEVVSVAKGLNLSALSDERSRIPVIGPMIDRFKGRGNLVIAEFESTRDQIERLVTEVDKTQSGLAVRNAGMEEMYLTIRQEHRMLGIHIAAGKGRLFELRIEAEDMRANIGNDPSKLQRVSDLDSMLSSLDKRIGDLTVLQQAAMQYLPMIRMIQNNNQMLVDKFHTIKEITLPAWKHGFLLRLSLNEQRNSVELARKIDDTTNELMVKNAQLLHRNSVETAKANQRLVIDVETLRKVQDTLIQTVEDVIRAQNDGAIIRKNAEKEIQGMRVDLQKRLSNKEAPKELH
jgi:uncharacterized protein YaaN involved in tellurite resistance